MGATSFHQGTVHRLNDRIVPLALQDISKCMLIKGLPCVLKLGIACQIDDTAIRLKRCHPIVQLQTGKIGHVNICHQHIHSLFLHDLKRLGS